MNNLKTKCDDIDAVTLKTIPIGLKKISDAVDNEVVKNTKLNTLKTKVNKLDLEVPGATALIYINQYNTDKQNLEKKVWEFG